MPAIVEGEKAVEQALSEGYFPVLNREIDVFAFPSSTGRVCLYTRLYVCICVTIHSDAKPQIYFMSLIDVLTNYGSRKRAAHAAKTMKHGVSYHVVFVLRYLL